MEELSLFQNDEIKFIHIADVHLGRNFTRYGERIGALLSESQSNSLRYILELARREEVRGVLISGDLFDSNYVSGALVAKVQLLFKGARVPIYLLPGSGDVTDRRPHDAYIETSVYKRPGWEDIKNLHIFKDTEAGEVVIDGDVAIYGRAIVRKGEEPIPRIQMERARYHILLIHGDALEMGYAERPDYPIQLSKLKDMGFNYVALGHWHSYKVSDLKTHDFLAAYPGVLHPLSHKDSEGRAILLKLGDGISIEPIEPPQIYFKTYEYSPTGDPKKDSSLITERFTEPERTLLRLSLKGSLPLDTLVDYRNELLKGLDSFLRVEIIDDQLFSDLSEENLKEFNPNSTLSILLRNLLKSSRESDEKKEAYELAIRYAYGLSTGKLTVADLNLRNFLRERFHEDL
jgi:DNA repair exonuclease SbcCD nuclease subunit